jgi:hypothetical protein
MLHDTADSARRRKRYELQGLIPKNTWIGSAPWSLNKEVSQKKQKKQKNQEKRFF